MSNRRGKKAGRKARLAIVRRDDLGALRSYFAERDQVLLPLLELIEDAQSSVDELMTEAARGFVERLLTLQQVYSRDAVDGGVQKRRGQMLLDRVQPLLPVLEGSHRFHVLLVVGARIAAQRCASAHVRSRLLLGPGPHVAALAIALDSLALKEGCYLAEAVS